MLYYVKECPKTSISDVLNEFTGSIYLDNSNSMFQLPMLMKAENTIFYTYSGIEQIRKFVASKIECLNSRKLNNNTLIDTSNIIIYKDNSDKRRLLKADLALFELERLQQRMMAIYLSAGIDQWTLLATAPNTKVLDNLSDKLISCRKDNSDKTELEVPRKFILNIHNAISELNK